jgi:hypothetical protein
MKNFTHKFIGITALLFTVSFNLFSQDLCYCSDVTNCYNQLNAMSTNYYQANSLATMYEGYYNTANQEINDLESQITSLQNQINSITPEDGISQADVDAGYAAGAASVIPEDGISQADVDAGYAAGAASVTPEDGISQADVDAATPLSLNIPLSLPEGWSLFGYSCIGSMDVIDGFSEIASNIEIVKNEMGLSYLPAWSFNAIGDLQYGEGYQIKLTADISNFQFCPTLSSRVTGCMDETVMNYNPNANTDDGSCIAAVTGCMDEGAFNYNPEANTDDDSCIEVVLGCTNEEDTENYDESANTDDGSCEPIFDGDGCAQLVANDPWTPLEFFSMMGMGTECEQVLSACSDGNDEACDFICEISDQYYEFGSCGCSVNLNCPDFAVVDYASGGGTYTYSQSEIHFIHGSGAQVTYNIYAPNAESVTLVVESGSDMIFNIYYQGSEPVVNLIIQSGTGSFNLIQQ